MSRRAGRKATAPSKSLVLLDLDDTLVFTDTMSSPVVPSHEGFVMVTQMGGDARHPVHALTYVRPFALTLMHTLHRLGYAVGVWSAGSPPYVADIVRALEAAAKSEGKAVPLVTVIALDGTQWVRVDPRTRRTRALLSAGSSGGVVVKDMAALLAAVPSLPRDTVLIDNIRHGPGTIKIPPFERHEASRDTVLWRLSKWFAKHASSGKALSERRDPNLARQAWQRAEVAPAVAPPLVPPRWHRGERAFIQDKRVLLGAVPVKVTRGVRTLTPHNARLRSDAAEVTIGNQTKRVPVRQLRRSLL